MDLHIGKVGENKNTEDKCGREREVCYSGTNLKTPKCGVNGICIGSYWDDSYTCVCKPGFRGAQCEKSEYDLWVL